MGDFEPAWRADPRGAFDLDRTATGRGTVPLVLGGQTHRVYRNANLSIYSAQPCNARCAFCVEELRPASRGLQLIEQKRYERDDDRYFARLDAALTAVAPLDPTASITGGEPSIDPRLPRIAATLARHGIRKRTMTTNASGLLDATDGTDGTDGADGADVLDAVLRAGLDHLNISRAHPDAATNQRIMRIDRPLPDAGLGEVIARARAARARPRLSCVLLRDRIDTLDGVRRYLDFAAALGADNVIFRELMRYDPATVQRNYVTRYSERARVAMRPIVEAIRPSDRARAGAHDFRFVRQVLGYYYYVEVYRYRDAIDVCFEGADLADIEADKRRRTEPVIHELVFHPDATLCSTWQPWDGRLM